MKAILSFHEYSQTIRQLPENYLIAHFDGKKWLCEPDLAADKKLCTRVFLELMNFESKYEQDGLKLLAKLTPNSEFNFKINNVVKRLTTLAHWHSEMSEEEDRPIFNTISNDLFNCINQLKEI